MFICATGLALRYTFHHRRRLSVCCLPPLFVFGSAYSPGLFFVPRNLLSSFHLPNVELLILQECKCARTDPGEREGIFPCYPVFPLDSPLPLPPLPHSSISPPCVPPLTPYPPFLLSLLDFCLSHSEILYRKPQLGSAKFERSIFKALKGLSVEGTPGFYHTCFISAVWGQNSSMAAIHSD